MKIFNALSESVAYRKQRSHRIEALADGVFAIAMTLLVLDIRVPVMEMKNEKEVWHSVLNVLPKISTFILSFSVAGQSWSVFTNHFNYMHTTDRNENVITMIYLMFVSLLPFSTAFLSEHLWSRVAMGFYIFNILLILTFNTLHWFYAYCNGLVKGEEETCIVIHKAILRRVKAKSFGYAIVVGCCFFSSYLALAGTIIIHIIFTFSGLIELLFSFSDKKEKYKSPLSEPITNKPHEETDNSNDDLN